MRLNCNRATGRWSAEPSSDGTNGRFRFGPLVATRALCSPPSLDENITRQADYFRSYLLKDGRLYLSLMADGGIFAWEPYAGESAGGDPPPAPDDGGPRIWEVTGVSRAVNMREQPSTTATIVATYGRGTMLDNLGCRRADDRVWCDVQKLGGGPARLRLCGIPETRRLDRRRSGACGARRRRFATVVVTKLDGRTRAIFFRNGVPIGADSSEADSARGFSATRESDLNLIRVGDERHEIPDAVILGG